MMINSILVINVFVVSANAGLLISLTAIQKDKFAINILLLLMPNDSIDFFSRNNLVT